MAKSLKGKKMGEVTNVLEETSSFPIVALGSSAGGLEANEAFFKNVAPDSDMAYIVITHLEPHHPSLLVEIISRCTTLETIQAKSEMAVQKNKIYVIPPGKGMSIAHGKLHLFSRETGHEPFMPIDNFLRSLAEDRKENAVAVILSGNGSDGSLGIRAINANLGMVMVQKSDTAKYDSMPKSAIETGLADYIQAPSEMPVTIFNYVHTLRTRKSPLIHEPVDGIDIMQKILSIVKRETGHDFSLYKKSTLNRRIERRMTVHQLDTKEKYAYYLLSNPKEIHLLFKEMIIDVTNFFRNPGAFDSLKNTLRRTVFETGSEKEFLRIWVSACSTGEEAYSIGILLKELMDETKRNIRVQIFGSDINEDAIVIARAGDYSLSIADNVDAVRLDKYFLKHEDGYKVKKEVREMIIFAPHDVVRDPPFLHLDLLSCRNLLIYFEPALQKQVLETCSTALNPGGILFLGESETINGCNDQFISTDSKWKIYERKHYAQHPLVREIEIRPKQKKDTSMKTTMPEKEPSMNEKAEKILLSEHTPPSLIVNEKNEIVYFHGPSSKYLEHNHGKASLCIRDLLHEDIRYVVMSAIGDCRKTGRTVIKNSVQVHMDDKTSLFNIIVRPLHDNEPATDVLVIFEERSHPHDVLKETLEQDKEPDREIKIEDLERELKYTKENLQITIEALEGTNEELMSTNEELQSNNEELQSVVEESETGKEELNSLNEELITVNSELERKNQELSRTNSDLRNLLNSVDEAIVFLDTDLRIRRFTPQMDQIMNLLPGDVGRPIKDIAMKIRYEELIADVTDVLDKLNTKEKEVKTKDGHWYKLKILPYRTIENVIDGAVITFSDIDLQKKTQDKLKDLK